MKHQNGMQRKHATDGAKLHLIPVVVRANRAHLCKRATKSGGGVISSVVPDSQLVGSVLGSLRPGGATWLFRRDSQVSETLFKDCVASVDGACACKIYVRVRRCGVGDR